MTMKDKKDMAKIDEIAEKAGGFVSPIFADNVHYDYRKIIAYCKEKQIDPRDMTIRELDSFIVS